MLPSLAKHVNSAARGTRQWQQRRQPQCHARSAALRYHRSAISLPQPPQPRTPSVLLFSPPPSCRLLTAPSPGGGVLLPHPTSFSISKRTAAATGPFCHNRNPAFLVSSSRNLSPYFYETSPRCEIPLCQKKRGIKRGLQKKRNKKKRVDALSHRSDRFSTRSAISP